MSTDSSLCLEVSELNATRSDPPVRTDFGQEIPSSVSFETVYRVIQADQLRHFPESLQILKDNLSFLDATHTMYLLPGAYEYNRMPLKKEVVLGINLKALRGPDGVYRIPPGVNTLSLIRYPGEMRCHDQALMLMVRVEMLCNLLNEYEFAYKLEGNWNLLESSEGAAGMNPGSTTTFTTSTTYTEEQSQQSHVEVGMSVTAGVSSGFYSIEATMSATFGRTYESMTSTSNSSGIEISIPSFMPTQRYMLDVWQRSSKMCAVYRKKNQPQNNSWIEYGPIYSNHTNRIEYKIFPEGILKID